MTAEDAKALAVGRAVLALVDALGLGSSSAPSVYTADALPPGMTRDAFLRRHRARVRAGVEGWTRAGQGRVVTREAWQTDAQAETTRTRRTASQDAANDVDAKLDAALGIRTRRAR